MLMLIQYTECYLYHSVMCSENDERIREIWNSNLQFEIGHLQFTNKPIERHYEKMVSQKYILPRFLNWRFCSRINPICVIQKYTR